jgi:hypothetical protein
MATAYDLELIPAPKDTMLVARQDGRLYVVNFSEYPHLDDPSAVDWCVSVSKLIVGKVQERRSRHLTLQEIECENTVQTNQSPPGSSTDMKLTVFGSMDGKNVDFEIDPHIVERDNGYVHAVTRATAKNFQIQLRGTYNINTMVLTYHNHGKR